MEAYNSCCGGAGNCKPGDCEQTRKVRELVQLFAREMEDNGIWNALSNYDIGLMDRYDKYLGLLKNEVGL